MGFLVVKKRINTRLFADLGGSSGGSGTGGQFENPPPGTVVDKGCTTAADFDFFLVSQFVRQGTVMPTHYHVVYDTSKLDPIQIQLLTFKLTHLYYNWPGTIRVPAPCQYAHKIAFLIGQSVQTEPSVELADKLYYL